MTQNNGLHRIAAHFQAEEQRLLGLIGKLSEEQRQLQLQLDHVRALAASLNGSATPAALATEPAPVAPAPEPVASAPAPEEAPPADTQTRPAPSPRGGAPKTARKRKAAKPKAGARKAAAPRKQKAAKPSTESAPTSVQDMSIVDAAIHFAEKHGKPTVDAGQILEWFEQEGYETRSGVPNRNSIYVSLNRERHVGAKAGRNRVTHAERGVFHFPEVAERLKSKGD